MGTISIQYLFRLVPPKSLFPDEGAFIIKTISLFKGSLLKKVEPQYANFFSASSDKSAAVVTSTYSTPYSA